MRAYVHHLLLAVTALVGACTSTSTELQTTAPVIAVDGPALDAVLVSSATPGLVTLELRITNMQTTPITLHFTSGQQYDFRVRRPDGTAVWLWSADKGFIDALTSRTLAPAETVVYTATWTPTARGSLIAEGWLTSTSYSAQAAAGLAVP